MTTCTPLIEHVNYNKMASYTDLATRCAFGSLKNALEAYTKTIVPWKFAISGAYEGKERTSRIIEK